MYRRQQYDRVDPRKVLPSRHTLFIRGLAGSTDVARVKEFFSEETNSKCSVDFFSMTEDRKRLGVAIRFKTNELAREMLTKYNNKNVLGCPVEITWFKDLKKARAKMFEEQRQGGGRNFQRSGFRNVRHAPGDRGMISTSPGHQYDNRRQRAGSSSSGGAAGYRSTANRERYSLSRSRSFTASSSRSRSRSGNSKSRSASHIRRAELQIADGFRNEDRNRGFVQPENRRFGPNQVHRSRSGSSSSAVSSSLPQAHPGANNTAPRSQRYNSNCGVASPLNYSHSRRDGEIHGSPSDKSRSFTAFSNAPAPEMDGGSSLVSGLIQLKRRNPQVQAQPDKSADMFQSSSNVRRRRQRSLGTSSSSGISREGSRGGRLAASDATMSGGPTASGGRKTNVGKRVNSPSPPFSVNLQRQRGFTKSGFEMEHDHALSGFSSAKRSKRVSSSPDSRGSLQKNYNREPSPKHTGTSGRRGHSPGFDQLPQSSGVRAGSGRRAGRTTNVTAESEEDADNRRSTHNRSPLYSTNNTPSRWNPPDTEHDDNNTEVKKRKLNSKPSGTRERVAVSAAAAAEEVSITGDGNSSISDDGSGDDLKADAKRFRCPSEVSKESDLKKSGAESAEVISDKVVDDTQPEDTVELIRQRKEALAQDYKRDCEAFTTVVRTLISKDPDLEAKLMPMLKEILHERGQRCIEELRSFIAGTNEGGVAGNTDNQKDDGGDGFQE